MIRVSLIHLLVAALVLTMLTALFLLYQNPLFEIYLSNWGIC